MTHSPVQLVLASASPARLELLKSAGINAIALPSHFDESLIQSKDPSELVQRLAAGKAQVIAKTQTEPALILGCDSVLELRGSIYGKPESREEACQRWREMRSQVGHLYTGHAIIDLYSHEHLVRYQKTDVYFADVSDDEIEAYVATEEPLHCAGCFALDGRGGFFIEKIDGCHSNVIGLSLPLLRQMLAALGFQAQDFWDI